MAKKKKQRKPNKSYKLKACHTETTVRVLSLDPGSRNFGIACVGMTKAGKPTVLANALFKNPITSLVDNLTESLDLFHKELSLWIRIYKPHAIIMERFQARGGMGPLIELVTTMTASICTEYRHTHKCKMITAATWKNKFNRKFSDTDLKEVYPTCLTTPHQLDATLIGIYGLEVGLQTEIDYDYTDIVKQVEATSAMPLRRVKGERK